MVDKVIERIARAIVGDTRYDALPDRMTRQDRLWASDREWHDREDAHQTAREALAALTGGDASYDLVSEWLEWNRLRSNLGASLGDEASTHCLRLLIAEHTAMVVRATAS